MTSPTGIFTGIQLHFVEYLVLFSPANSEHNMGLHSIYLGFLI